jgi:hypothetical protein
MFMASENSDRLSREELISMALLMLLAGHDTKVNLITNDTPAFLRSPSQLALLQIALGKLFERFPRPPLAVAPETLTYRESTLMHGPVSLSAYL